MIDLNSTLFSTIDYFEFVSCHALLDRLMDAYKIPYLLPDKSLDPMGELVGFVLIDPERDLVISVRPAGRRDGAFLMSRASGDPATMLVDDADDLEYWIRYLCSLADRTKVNRLEKIRERVERMRAAP